jgi:ParB-like chromosome segregation protein Spo0J
VLPWRNVLRTHQAAAVFPLLKDAQPDAFEALVEDVKQYGVTETIKLVHDGARYIVIDGRNRLDALQELEMDVWRNIADGGNPDPEHFDVLNEMLPTDEDVRTYVNSLNVHRRHMHMTAEARREWVARVLRHNPETSNRTVAEMTHAAEKTVKAARAEMESSGAIPEVKTTKGKDGKVRKTKPAKSTEVPKPKLSPQETAKPSLMTLWAAATDQERHAFVRQVTPAALVACYGMPAFYRVMSEGQKQAIDDELARMWEVKEAEQRVQPSPPRNVARDIGAIA